MASDGREAGRWWFGEIESYLLVVSEFLDDWS